MATFKKRGNTWQAQVSKKGVRCSATFNTKSQAKEWAAVKEVEIAQEKSGKAGLNKTLSDAFDRYVNEVSPTKKGYRWERVRLKMFKRFQISTVLMSDLSASDIAFFRDERLKAVAGSTVNRELNMLSAVLTTAKREWLWIDNNPVSEIKRPKNPRPRDKRIDQKLIFRVLDCLGYQYQSEICSKLDLLAVYFLIAIETALRLGEICALTHGDVFIEQRYVVIRDSKNSDKRNVPLTTKAVSLFELVLSANFTIAADSASTLFRRYCKKAGIDDLHFHDTRHEALTNLAQKLDVLDLARMVGHRDPRSLMIYYNATATEIAKKLD